MTAGEAEPRGEGPRAWAPVLGPVDRTSFFEEQRRHRRSTWRLSALCLLAVVAMGLVVSCIVGPLLLLQLSLMTQVVGIFVTVPDVFWRPLNVYFDVIDAMFQGLEGTREVGTARIVLGLVAVLLPGVGLLVLIWFWLRAFLLRAGVGSVLLTLGARDPRAGDLEEQQLVNVVAEMAIAAGVRPPRVVLLDSDVPNAAAIGSSADDATVVVSRRLLDEFDRDQTQGALGHLIGSIGNGDLRIAFTIVSVFQTLGLLMTLLDAPFSAGARTSLLRILRTALRPPGRDAAGEAEAATALLGETLKDARLTEIGKFVEPDPDSWLGRFDRRTLILRGFRVMLVMPLLFANLFGKIALMVFIPLLTGPLIALVWRSRRYLADATAVQLTRNPDGLAYALVELIEKGGLPPGGRWAAHLFVVGTEVAHARAQRRYRAQLEQWVRERAGRRGTKPLAAALELTTMTRQAEQASEAADKDTFADQFLIMVNFHPPLEKRLARLRVQGATIAA